MAVNKKIKKIWGWLLPATRCWKGEWHAERILKFYQQTRDTRHFEKTHIISAYRARSKIGARGLSEISRIYGTVLLVHVFSLVRTLGPVGWYGLYGCLAQLVRLVGAVGTVGWYAWYGGYGWLVQLARHVWYARRVWYCTVGTVGTVHLVRLVCLGRCGWCGMFVKLGKLGTVPLVGSVQWGR
jgi:hypothetical protein